MEIIHNIKSTGSFSLSTVRGGQRNCDNLKETDKALLNQMAEAFTIVTGGHFKTRRQSA